MLQKKGLGKGLGSLLGEDAVTSEEREHSEAASAPAKSHNPVGSDVYSESSSGKGYSLRLTDVEPNPAQPRKNFDNELLGELADSIASHGVLQPISVRPGVDGRYIIVAGERRWRAARLAGLDEIPALILEVDEGKAAELALIENLQREDLNPVEEAEGYRALAVTYGLSQQEIADRVSKSRSSVANSLRLLTLDSEILELLADGSITLGHARPLIPLSPAEQTTVADRVVRDGLSVRQVEQLCAKIQQEPPLLEEKPIPVAVNYTDVLAGQLGEKLGRRVVIHGGRKKGRLELEYYGVEDLNRLCDLLGALES